MIKKGLGKGLDAFFPPINTINPKTEEIKEQVVDKVVDNNINEMAIDEIITNAGQPRKNFDETAIEELAESIKKYGIIEPIVVSKEGSKYQIIAGERRYRAAKVAGLETIPVVIKEYDEKAKSEVALIENIQRKDLNILEEAQAYKEILEKYNMSQEELAKNIGKSRSSISNTMRILKFDDEIKKYIVEDKISEGHCKVLASVQDKNIQIKLAKKVAEEGISVRKLEEFIKAIDEPKVIKRVVKTTNVWIQDIEEKFKSFFQTKVEIKPDKDNKKGKIILEYYSNDELDRILETINRG